MSGSSVRSLSMTLSLALCLAGMQACKKRNYNADAGTEGNPGGVFVGAGGQGILGGSKAFPGAGYLGGPYGYRPFMLGGVPVPIPYGGQGVLGGSKVLPGGGAFVGSPYTGPIPNFGFGGSKGFLSPAPNTFFMPSQIPWFGGGGQGVVVPGGGQGLLVKGGGQGLLPGGTTIPGGGPGPLPGGPGSNVPGGTQPGGGPQASSGNETLLAQNGIYLYDCVVGRQDASHCTFGESGERDDPVDPKRIDEQTQQPMPLIGTDGQPVKGPADGIIDWKTPNPACPGVVEQVDPSQPYILFSVQGAVGKPEPTGTPGEQKIVEVPGQSIAQVFRLSIKSEKNVEIAKLLFSVGSRFVQDKATRAIQGEFNRIQILGIEISPAPQDKLKSIDPKCDKPILTATKIYYIISNQNPGFSNDPKLNGNYFHEFGN